MNLFGGVTRSLAGLAIVAVVAAIGVLALLATPRGRRWIGQEFEGREVALVSIAWLVAAVAMGGSLFFSEVVGFIPCLFCWYQRVAMFPLVFILGIAVLLKDSRIWRYVLPLSVIGLFLSTYHTIIELRPTLAVGSCDAAAPCNVRLFAVLGFISPPVMAGAAFLLIAALMLALRSIEQGAGSDMESATIHG